MLLCKSGYRVALPANRRGPGVSPVTIIIISIQQGAIYSICFMFVVKV